MIYHRIQKGDKIISFLNYKSIPFTIEEEAEHKAYDFYNRMEVGKSK